LKIARVGKSNGAYRRDCSREFGVDEHRINLDELGLLQRLKKEMA
jgi:hypothetical protein